jgi:hypothetical protein
VELQTKMHELTTAVGVDVPNRKAVAALLNQAESMFDRALGASYYTSERVGTQLHAEGIVGTWGVYLHLAEKELASLKAAGLSLAPPPEGISDDLAKLLSKLLRLVKSGRDLHTRAVAPGVGVDARAQASLPLTP